MFARIGQLQRSPQGNLGKIELSSKQWELREGDGDGGDGGRGVERSRQNATQTAKCEVKWVINWNPLQCLQMARKKTDKIQGGGTWNVQ